MTFYAIPDYIKNKVESGKEPFANFGLLFQKFYPYDRAPKPTDTKIPHNNSINKLAVFYARIRNTSEILNHKNKKQIEFLENVFELSDKDNILQLTATTISNLLTGIGENTPGEVGMVFDRNSGLPYIPASSIKGAVRTAYTINYARKVNREKVTENEVPGLTDIFGSLDTQDSLRGGFVFMDAYSENIPVIAEDVMTPHFSNYYDTDNKDHLYPVENENPVPIKFLVVKKGATFNFRGFFLNEEAKKYREELIEAFKTALIELGLGAKTTSGYGRFDNIENTTNTISSNVEHRKEKEEEERKARLEAEEKARLEAERKAKEEEEKARLEAERKAQEERKARLKEEWENATGIHKDILALEHGFGNPSPADLYKKYLDNKKDFDENDLKLAELIYNCDEYKKYHKKNLDNLGKKRKYKKIVPILKKLRKILNIQN